jgi:hypothetical protein
VRPAKAGGYLTPFVTADLHLIAKVHAKCRGGDELEGVFCVVPPNGKRLETL